MTPQHAASTPHERRFPDHAVAVRADGLRVRLGGAEVVRDLTLEVEVGELFAILGPSGCGKTTALRLIAGFERPTAGCLTLFDEEVACGSTFVPPEKRRVGMVFQDYALFPHMSVAENVAYGLPKSADREARVLEVLDLTRLTGLGDRDVHALSGGEQQRVALARALAPGPRILLLDEPFSNLDQSLRGRVRGEVRDIIKRAGATAILVTHDQEEALSIADRVAFMWGGRVEQVATPDEIYTSPRTLNAADFIGDANILHLPVRDGHVQLPFGDFDAPEGAEAAAVVIRPEDLQIMPGGVYGQVVSREYYGHDQVLHVELEESGLVLRVRVAPHERLGMAGPISIGLRTDPLVLAESGAEDGG
ncbi:MAG: ABC transporter ATP-binding protein [Dehalococcoidia bacterium]|nr:ABC transporter ATP-binding protein [Dehalococcoidia bacterium]